MGSGASKNIRNAFSYYEKYDLTKNALPGRLI